MGNLDMRTVTYSECLSTFYFIRGVLVELCGQVRLVFSAGRVRRVMAVIICWRTTYVAVLVLHHLRPMAVIHIIVVFFTKTPAGTLAIALPLPLVVSLPSPRSLQVPLPHFTCSSWYPFHHPYPCWFFCHHYHLCWYPYDYPTHAYSWVG